MSVTYPESWSKLQVVLSHDWLTGMRGGERVLQLLGDGFPAAPIFTLIHNRAVISESINRHPITTSWLQHAPAVMKHYRYYLPFFTAAVERMRPPAADLLISTNHCIAKGLRSKPGTKQLCYCFTPMRYAWLFYDEYFGGSPLKKAVIKPLLCSLRDWDKRTADRVDTFVTLSRHVQERIKKFYGRDADVVYPPVNVDFYTPGQNEHDGFDLVVSALVPYKRVDLAVRAYNRLGYPLKIVGTGTEFDTLKRSARPNIEFLGWQSDEANRDLYRRCRSLIFPGEEDFGIVPVEAQACGRPVVAYGKGGLLETVVENVTGVFFREQTEESLLAAIETCAGRKWDLSAIRKNTERFAPQEFINGIDRNISKCMSL
jgi:glycosyltransferase involved in cell wall biosynthesis